MNVKQVRKSYPKKDLTGMKIGKLTPLYWIRGGKWMCSCDCGNMVMVDTRALCSKRPTLSCGCLMKEKSRKLAIDMTGYEDNNLLVLERVGSDNQRIAKWRCMCKHCGNIFITRGSTIRNKDTQSCGCVHSQNELKIINMLTEAKAEFATQYTFSDLIGIGNRLLRFDFAVFEDHKLHHLIEFNGLQHYARPEGKWAHMYDTLREHDRRKREYCAINNIELRIIDDGNPYTLADLL